MGTKKFDLESYKSKIKDREVQYKKDSFIPVAECLQEVLGLPGIPRGHITQIYGKSDTGKTSLLFHMAAEAQKSGDLPIVYITEGKVDWDRALEMGFDREGYALIEESYTTLEEVFEDMLEKLNEQRLEQLPKRIVFFWDSIGNTVSKDEFKLDKDGKREIKATMMKAAKVIKNHLRHVNPLINDSRKIDRPYDVSLVFINQAYTTPPAFQGALPGLKPYGGDGIWYAASLVIQTKRKGKLYATKDKIKMKFAINSTLTIEKNHINGIEQSGEFIITINSIIPNEKKAIDAYKKESKEDWGTLDLLEEEDES